MNAPFSATTSARAARRAERGPNPEMDEFYAQIAADEQVARIAARRVAGQKARAVEKREKQARAVA